MRPTGAAGRIGLVFGVSSYLFSLSVSCRPTRCSYRISGPYERFALQVPDGNLDPVHGFRQFVVGTGGDALQGPVTLDPNSEAAEFSTYGALGLTLNDGSYDWQFIAVDGQTFADEGSASCVDPSTDLDVRIAAGDDDAEERADGRMLVGSSDLEFTFDGGADQTVGLRFASVNVPDGATITNAWVQFGVDETSSTPTSLRSCRRSSPITSSARGRVRAGQCPRHWRRSALVVH